MLTPSDKTALLQFLKDWAKPLNEILTHRFGKNKIAHVIIALDTGNEPTVSYVTNLRDRDFKRLLKMLSDSVNSRKIETLN